MEAHRFWFLVESGSLDRLAARGLEFRNQ
jgi:hypothetical protein